MIFKASPQMAVIKKTAMPSVIDRSAGQKDRLQVLGDCTETGKPLDGEECTG